MTDYFISVSYTKKEVKDLEVNERFGRGYLVNLLLKTNVNNTYKVVFF
jgi:hypothetical protein